MPNTMPVKEIIDGLNDHAEDRRSFFDTNGPSDDDAIFRHDEKVLRAAAAYIQEREGVKL